MSAGEVSSEGGGEATAPSPQTLPEHVPTQFTQMPSMPQFFNPFMSPFMPQGEQPQSVQQQQVPMPFMFTPAQYQEMMQQYLQQMIASGQIQLPQQFDKRPDSQTDSLSESRIASSLRDVHISAAASPSRSVPTSQASPDKSDRSCASGASAAEVPLSAGVDEPTPIGDVIPDREEEEEERERDLLAPSTEPEPIKETPSQDASVNGDGSPPPVDQRKEDDKDRTASLIKKQMSEIEKEISRRSQNKNIKQIDDRELAELIACSMATVSTSVAPPPTVSQPGDDHTTATFTANFDAMPAQSALPTFSAPSQQPAATKETLNQLRCSFNLPEGGGLPPPPAPTNALNGPVRQNPFMSSSSAAVGMVASPAQPPAHTTQPVVSQPQPTAMPGMNGVQMQQMQQMHMNGIHPGMMQGFMMPSMAAPMSAQPGVPSYPFASPFINPALMGQNGVPHFTQEQLAAALAQQQAQAAGFGLAPPPFAPPPMDSTRQNGKAADGAASADNMNDWPDDSNKENGASGSGEEPVWVMRDSYLKRQQREQQAQQEWAEPQQAEPVAAGDDDEGETDRLLLGGGGGAAAEADDGPSAKKKPSKETMVHEPAVLIEGVLFRARYLGSTQLSCETRGSKAARMAQAQEAVARVKAPTGEIQPSTDIDLFISTEKIMVLNTDLQRISDTDVRQDILMDHALRTISYIADIGDLVVLMARRMSQSASDENCPDADGVRKSPRVICHVFESEEAAFIAQSIGQAFQVAYVEFLRANGIDDPSYLRQIDYQEVLNSQELLGDELEMFARKETQKDVVVPKKAGEALGVVVVESGWGSMLPTVVLAHMAPTGPAARSNQLNIGDQIININGISLVGLPLSAAIQNIKNQKTATVVKLTVVSTPPVVEVRIRRPDTKYQLGFSVQNGVICSLLRGGIAERGGIRVGHRIIEINHQSVVAVAHDRIVNMLATAIGEIHMKTMPTSMFRLLTGQEVPQYI